jgi:DtxR family Mn-dependent transcriptional regulator
VLTPRKLEKLPNFRPGQRVLIREAQDDNPDRLRRWQELGLVPGAVVTIRSYQPLDSLFEVEVAGRVLSLGREGLVGLLGEAV